MVQWDTGDLNNVYTYRADIDDDGDVEEVLVSSYIDGSNDQHAFIRVISPSSTNQPNYEWTSPDFEVYTSLSINDIDNDGDQEMILRTFNGSGSAVQGDIRIIGGASHQTEWLSSDYEASVWGMEADVDGDGGLDLINIWTNSGGKYYEVLDGTTRTPIWSAVNHSSNFNLVANDHDADGDIELVVTEWNHSWVSGTSIPIYSSRITSYDGATLQEEWSTGWKDHISNSWFLDIDADPQLEILEMRHASVNGSTLYSFAVRDGPSMQEQWVVGPSESFIYANPAEVDASSPGMELIMKRGQKELEVRNSSNGLLLWNTTANQSIYGIAKDIDNDGWGELLISTDGRVDIRNGTSYQLKWTTGYLGEQVTTQIYDVDNDNRLELILFVEPTRFTTEIHVFDAEMRTLEWTSSLLTGSIYATAGGWGDFDGDSLIDGIFTRIWYTNSNQTQHAAAFLLEFEDRNSAPNIILSSPNEGETYIIGSAIQFDASGSKDPDGDLITFQWSSSIDGILSNQSTFITSNLSLGIHQITLLASDERGHEIWVNRTVVINEIPNEAPIATMSLITGGTENPIDEWEVSNPFTLSAVGSTDPEMEPLEYLWTSTKWGEIGTTEQVTLQFPEGSTSVTLRVDDGEDADETTVVLTVVMDEASGPLQLHIPDGNLSGDVPITWSLDAILPDSAAVRLDLLKEDGTLERVLEDDLVISPYEWDTTSLAPGEWILRIETYNDSGAFHRHILGVEISENVTKEEDDGENEHNPNDNSSHNGTLFENTTQAVNDTFGPNLTKNQSTTQETNSSSSISVQNQTKEVEDMNTEGVLEKAAESTENRGNLFGLQFIVMGVVIVIIFLSITVLVRKGSGGIGNQFDPHQEISAMPVFLPQQWTDEAGHTWRKMADGRIQWWNGVGWQDI